MPTKKERVVVFTLDFAPYVLSNRRGGGDRCSMPRTQRGGHRRGLLGAVLVRLPFVPPRPGEVHGLAVERGRLVVPQCGLDFVVEVADVDTLALDDNLRDPLVPGAHPGNADVLTWLRAIEERHRVGALPLLLPFLLRLAPRTLPRAGPGGRGRGPGGGRRGRGHRSALASWNRGCTTTTTTTTTTAAALPRSRMFVVVRIILVLVVLLRSNTLDGVRAAPFLGTKLPRQHAATLASLLEHGRALLPRSLQYWEHDVVNHGRRAGQGALLWQWESVQGNRPQLSCCSGTCDGVSVVRSKAWEYENSRRSND